MLRRLVPLSRPLWRVRGCASATPGPIKVPDSNSQQPAALDPYKYDEWGEEIPEDLRLQEPADPRRRAIAGLIDATISVAVGGIVWGLVSRGTAVTEIAEIAGIMSATAAWAGRDAIIDDGNRSIGEFVCDYPCSSRVCVCVCVCGP